VAWDGIYSLVSLSLIHLIANCFSCSVGHRRGFMLREYDLEVLAEKAQYDLFRKSCSERHCLNHLYAVNTKPTGAMRLRQRGLDFYLPTIQYEFNKKHLLLAHYSVMFDGCCKFMFLLRHVSSVYLVHFT